MFDNTLNVSYILYCYDLRGLFLSEIMITKKSYRVSTDLFVRLSMQCINSGTYLYGPSVY